MFKSKPSYITLIVFIISLYLIYLLTIEGEVIPALIFACLPAIMLCSVKISQNQYYFYFFFITNYLIMGISRYIPMKTGMVMLGLSLAVAIIFFLKSIFKPYDWKRCVNLLTVSWTIWFIYCLFELFNPRGVNEAWFISIAGYALLPLLFAIITPILFTHFKNLKWFLVIWAFLTILAVLKSFWQKNFGFDSAELYWLFVEGGATTHIIYSGVRYFSFFSDAANFGITMGLSLTIFSISGFFVSSRRLKCLFWTTGFLSAYGLIISGTRSAVVIPIVGLIVYVILCRNLKYTLLSGTILLVLLLFLTQTHIGNGNALIRRMRSTFDKEDASLQVRYINKEKMTPLMKNKPFGIGLGLSGSRATRFNVKTKLSELPPDSLLTMYWIETGIVGLSLYLTLVVLVLLRAAYVTMFVIRNKHLKNIIYSIIAGLSGAFVAAYVNDITTYPNGVIMSILFAFLFTAPYYDKEFPQHEETN